MYTLLEDIVKEGWDVGMAHTRVHVQRDNALGGKYESNCRGRNFEANERSHGRTKGE